MHNWQTYNEWIGVNVIERMSKNKKYWTKGYVEVKTLTFHFYRNKKKEKTKTFYLPVMSYLTNRRFSKLTGQYIENYYIKKTINMGFRNKGWIILELIPIEETYT